MAGEKILLVEDDSELRGIVSKYLIKEGYEVVTASDGEEGVRLAGEENPVLILLDLMLPKVDGFEVCRQIRNHSVAPIMILSAKNSDTDKMLSLGLGADDYLEKPFSLLELGARVKSHIRRYTSFSKPVVEETSKKKVMGEVTLDPDAYRVWVREKEITLTTREFQLLDFLMSNPSKVFSKEQLLDAVWGYNEFVDNNTITVYVGRLREKMTKAGACYIKTVWGAGYKWEM